MEKISKSNIFAWDFFAQEFLKNTRGAYLIALCIVGVGLVLSVLLRKYVLNKVENWQNTSSTHGVFVNKKIAVNLVRSLFSLLPLLPVYWGLQFLTFSPKLSKGIDAAFLILFTLAIIRFAANLLSFALDALLRQQGDGRNAKVGIGALLPIVRTLVWALGLTFLLDNLGFQISTIVAGLGIMGVAVGLAGQTILADFFSYLVILLDKPFDIGDLISLDGVTAHVERIGIKTTKLRSWTGEILVVPNGNLTKKLVSNFDKAISRTKIFRFGVEYETPLEKLRTLPQQVYALSAKLDNVRINRVHLVNFGDSSLDFEVSMTVDHRDLKSFLDAQQTLFFALMEVLNQEQIEFAYPVQKNLMVQDSAV